MLKAITSYCFKKKIWAGGLIIITLYSWVGTLAGLKLTLYLLSCQLPGTLRIEGLQGRLMSPIQFNYLHYQDNTSECKIENCWVSFQKSSFLSGKIIVKNLKIANIVLTNYATQKSMPSWKKLSRLSIKQATIDQGKLYGNQYTATISGAIGKNKRLAWCIVNGGIPWLGELITRWHKDCDTQLVVQANPPKDSDKNTKQPVQQASRISLTVQRVPTSSFFDPALLNVIAKGVISDLRLLSYISEFLDPLYFDQQEGRVIIDAQLTVTRFGLSRGIHSPSYLLRSNRLKKAELSFRWEKPTLASWGDFKELILYGCWKKNHVVWRGELVGVDQSEAPSTWYIKGKTDYSHNRILQSAYPFKTHLQLMGDPIHFFPNTHYPLKAEPLLNISIINGAIKARGKLRIPYGRFSLRVPEIEPTPDADIRFTEHNAAKSLSWPVDLKIALVFEKDVWLYYSGLKAQLQGEIELIKKREDSVIGKGTLKLIAGHYYFGQLLHLSPRSRLIFNERIDNPSMDIEATRDVAIKLNNESPVISPINFSCPTLEYPPLDQCLPSPLKIGIHLRGKLDAPSMHLFVKPAGWISIADDPLSYLVTGQPTNPLNQYGLTLLLNIAEQLAKGYVEYNPVPSYLKTIKQGIQFKASESTQQSQLVLSGTLFSTLRLHWKIAFNTLNSDIALSYEFSQYLNACLSMDYSSKNSAFELFYQREW